MKSLRGDRRRRPMMFADESTRHRVAMAGGCPFLNEGTHRRLGHDAAILALQPMIPPTRCLLQEADRRSGHAVLRIDMRPRPYQPAAWHLQAFEQARNG